MLHPYQTYPASFKVIMALPEPLVGALQSSSQKSTAVSTGCNGERRYDSCSMRSASVRKQIFGLKQGRWTAEITHLDILDVCIRADPAAKGGLGEAWVLLDQLLLPNARLRQARLVQPLHIVQAQPLRLQALLICSRRRLCQVLTWLDTPFQCT